MQQDASPDAWRSPSSWGRSEALFGQPQRSQDNAYVPHLIRWVVRAIILHPKARRTYAGSLRKYESVWAGDSFASRSESISECPTPGQCRALPLVSRN